MIRLISPAANVINRTDHKPSFKGSITEGIFFGLENIADQMGIDKKELIPAKNIVSQFEYRLDRERLMRQTRAEAEIMGLENPENAIPKTVKQAKKEIARDIIKAETGVDISKDGVFELTSGKVNLWEKAPNLNQRDLEYLIAFNENPDKSVMEVEKKLLKNELDSLKKKPEESQNAETVEEMIKDAMGDKHEPLDIRHIKHIQNSNLRVMSKSAKDTDPDVIKIKQKADIIHRKIQGKYLGMKTSLPTKEEISKAYREADEKIYRAIYPYSTEAQRNKRLGLLDGVFQ